MQATDRETTPLQARRRRFDVAEYYRMAEAGTLGENDRVELIEREVVEIAAMGSRHAACIDRLNRTFNRLVGKKHWYAYRAPSGWTIARSPNPTWLC